MKQCHPHDLKIFLLEPALHPHAHPRDLTQTLHPHSLCLLHCASHGRLAIPLPSPCHHDPLDSRTTFPCITALPPPSISSLSYPPLKRMAFLVQANDEPMDPILARPYPVAARSNTSDPTPTRIEATSVDNSHSLVSTRASMGTGLFIRHSAGSHCRYRALPIGPTPSLSSRKMVRATI
jgi:hypothetical protein